MVSLTFSPAEVTKRRERITSFISAQVEAAGVSDVVIGLSGGLDSSLTATLASEALGPEAVHGYSFPARVTSEETKNDAAALADHLDINYTEIEIAPLVDTVIEQSQLGDVSDQTRGNASARIRSVLSYAIANEQNRLVLGTGNRSEALVGYFTKYGDGAVDCHPIGNLYKCQVRQLARAVGVPERIVEKPPSAELWADQTDEEELGITYDVLDPILALHVDGPLSVAATAATVGCSADTVREVDRLVRNSTHKRHIPPSP